MIALDWLTGTKKLQQFSSKQNSKNNSIKQQYLVNYYKQ